MKNCSLRKFLMKFLLRSLLSFFFFFLLKILKKHIHSGMRVVSLYVGNFIGIRIISKSTSMNIYLEYEVNEKLIHSEIYYFSKFKIIRCPNIYIEFTIKFSPSFQIILISRIIGRGVNESNTRERH